MKKLNMAVMFFLVAQTWAQGTWNQVGPYGGYIQSLAKDAGGNIYAGTLFGGIFKTTNNGDLWVQVYNDTNVVDVRSLAVNSTGHIFAGLDPGFMRSTNGGATWQRIVNSLNTRTIATLLVLPNGNIFAGALSGGLYRSTDNGQTFSLYTNGMSASSIRMVARNATNGHLFTATNGNGVFRSTDEGANWVAINTGLSTTIMNSVAVGPAGELFASGDTKIFRSTNNGDSWTDVLAPSAAYWDFAFAGTSVFVAYAGSAAVGGGVAVSTNNGSTWTAEPGLVNVPFNRIIANVNTVVAGCLGWGTYRTTASVELRVEWTHQVNGMTNTHVTDIEDTNGTIYVSTRYSGIFKSTDAGIAWTNISSGLPYGWTQSISRVPNGTLFAGHQNGIYRSIDQGTSWSSVHPAFLATLGSNDRGRVFAGSGASIYISTNNGDNWSTRSLPGVINISDIESIPDTDEVLVAAGNPSGATGQGVFRSTDNGDTWTPFNTGLTNLNVTALAVDRQPSSCPRIILSTWGNGIFRLANQTWSPDGLENFFIRDLRSSIGNVQFGVSRAILFLRDLRCLWVQTDGETFGLEMVRVLPLPPTPTFPQAANAVLVATNGRGIFRVTNVVTSTPEKSISPQEFRLDQNYPNPFNPRTTIVYRVRSRESVELKVYDLLGREVATLVNEVQAPGEYTVTLDGSKLASGVYLYRLISGDFLSTRKLVLLK